MTVIGGSHGLTGAPMLSAFAAMRAGAGYVSIATARSLEASFAQRPLEAMLSLLPDEDGVLTPMAVDPTLKAIRRADAVVLGPGLGRGAGAIEFAREMYERVDVPLVIDADGLNALEGVFPEDIPHRRWPTVLTPHEGELGRMLGIPSADVAKRRLELARAAAAESKSFVVLKGDDTLVAVADRPRGGLARRCARAGHGRHRGRPGRRDRGAARPRDAAGAGRVRGGVGARARRADRRRAARAGRRHRHRRRRGAAGGAGVGSRPAMAQTPFTLTAE